MWRQLSRTDASQLVLPLSTKKPLGTAARICGGCASNEMAKRRLRLGAIFKLGEIVAFTSTEPEWNKYIRYSRHGEFWGGVTLSAVTGNMDIDESVRPRSSIFSQRALAESCFFV